MTKKKYFTYEDLKDSKREKMLLTPKNEFTELLNNKHAEIVNTINTNFVKLNNRQNKLNTDFAKLFKKMDSTLKTFSDKLASNEETLLFLMHNIKKNQFLYAHYPDDWVKSYINIKDSVSFENEYLDNKIEEHGN